jgi:bacteriocin biosynthesis cyclodehydratase domain-containing protein
MSVPLEARPRLLSHYYVLRMPTDRPGEEELAFVSGLRRVTIRGRGLETVRRRLLPLLDGTRTVGDLLDRDAAGIPSDQLRRCIAQLASLDLLVLEDDRAGDGRDEQLGPQLSFFHEVAPSAGAAQGRLRDATVAVVGLGGAGAHAALAMAACQVGEVRCVDDGVVGPGDPYLAPVLAGVEAGHGRAAAIGQRLEQLRTDTVVSTFQEDLTTEENLHAAVKGCDFVVCTVDKGRLGISHRVNRACLREAIPWTSCALEGAEAVLGPTVLPGSTACYLCYRMRAIACSDRPEAELAFESMLEDRNQDDSSRRENLTFAAGILGNLAALEAFKALTGVGTCAVAGGILVIDLVRGGWQRHTVLRKPWCPACFPGSAGSRQQEALP